MIGLDLGCPVQLYRLQLLASGIYSRKNCRHYRAGPGDPRLLSRSDSGGGHVDGGNSPAMTTRGYGRGRLLTVNH
jgi:hypothetical protein